MSDKRNVQLVAADRLFRGGQLFIAGDDVFVPEDEVEALVASGRARYPDLLQKQLQVEDETTTETKQRRTYRRRDVTAEEK